MNFDGSTGASILVACARFAELGPQQRGSVVHRAAHLLVPQNAREDERPADILLQTVHAQQLAAECDLAAAALVNAVHKKAR